MSLAAQGIGDGRGATQTGGNLWRYVGKLLRMRAVLTISGFRRAKLRRKIFTIVLIALILAFAVSAFLASRWLLGFLRSPSLAQDLARQNLGDINGFLENMPVLILSGEFIGILLTSFGVLLQALYLAGDMDFLLSTPVPMRAVFVTKLLQAVLPNFGLIALFGLPVLFGLGAAGGYNFLYYPLVVIVLASLALAAAGLSGLMVMSVVRIFPAKRVAEVLGFLGATLSILLSQSGNLIGSSRFADRALAGGQLPLSLVSRFNTPWSPLSWAGRGLVDLGQGRWLTGIGFLALTLGSAALLFSFSLNTAERLYYSGWAGMQVSLRRKSTARALPAAARTPHAATLVERLVPSPVRAIVLKDFLVLRRDLRSLSQVITPIILGTVYAISLLRSGGQPVAPTPGDDPAWLLPVLANLRVYGSVGISLFVGWSLLSRLALMGFSHEGKTYWLLKSAPVGEGRLMLAKFLVAYLPSLILGWSFMLIISLVQHAGLSVFVFSMAVIALSMAGMVGLSLSFGVAGANLTWEDPRRMNAGWTGCLSMLVSVAFLGLSLALFFIPPIILAGLGLPQIAGQLTGLALGGSLSLACALLAPRLVLRRIALIGET